MASYDNFTSKNKKHSKDRTDIYDPDFSSPVNPNDNSNVIRRNLSKWVEFCSFLR